MAAIALCQLTKSYRGPRGSVPALRDFSLEVDDCELMVLVGPSGCGKTTTLRLVAGLERPDSGEVRIGGRVVNDIAPRNRDVAMVFQDLALYPHMTVFQNMAFGLRMRDIAKAEARRMVEETARQLGIDHLLDRKPNALSGGERQRVALGRAVVRRPRVFLLDEPLSSLDAPLRAAMRSEIKDLQRKLGTTMIYVTHDQEEAMMLGDRLAVLRDGVLQQVGAPMDVYQRPANCFVAGFFGDPPMNLLSGLVDRSEGSAIFRGSDGMYEVRPDDSHGLPFGDRSEIVMGIRPEHVAIRWADVQRGRCAAGPLAGPKYVPEESNRRFVRLAKEFRVAELEPRGATIRVRLTSETGTPLVATLPPEPLPRMGTCVEAYLDASRLHWFESSAQTCFRSELPP